MRVLLTGGAGYIGSHTALELLEAGHEVTVLDNLYNASTVALERVKALTGREPDFIRGDILDRELLDKVLSGGFDAVIHFAGLKAVGESVRMPLAYYWNNVAGTVVLLEAMKAAGTRNLVFSSSATVYGDPERLPLDEECRLQATNPYGRTKLMIEEILRDLAAAEPEWRISILRYFNPVGAHPSGMIGEDPSGIPNNLVPFVSQVAVGRIQEIKVFGDDYPTHDGTGVRDYLHVVDLAQGHLAALERLVRTPGLETFNLGTGTGYSVLDVVKAFGKACGKDLPYRIVERRPGDTASCYTDPAKAKTLLGWEAKLGLDDMCRDAWNWQSRNPQGYR